MISPQVPNDSKSMAAAIDAELRALTHPDTPSERAVRRRYSQALKHSGGEFVLSLARDLFKAYGRRWIAYELIQAHPDSFRRLGASELEEFGGGINSWETADSFARTLSDPAWLHGQVSDGLILKWARSQDLWWRRVALVSTVAWNVRSQGGHGDIPRTLTVCKLLVGDHTDMVVKAMSWALRELVVHDPGAVREFLEKHQSVLAPRVQREVGNKLLTSLKSPRKKIKMIPVSFNPFWISSTAEPRGRIPKS